MSDDKPMNAVKLFCAKRFAMHGSKRASSKGRYDHDWSDLVDQVSYFDFGHKQKDEAKIQAIGRHVRAEFPNPPSIARGSEWDQAVNAPGAHERILAIIRNGLAEIEPAPENGG
jgi:hypothetical protein